jgi:integrase
MSIFDKNAKRLKELERSLLEAGPALKIRIQKRIDKIVSAGPEWFVVVKGRAYKCPPDYQSEVGASEYDERTKDRAESGRALPSNLKHSSVAQMCDYYLQYKEKRLEKGKEKKGTVASAKTLCGHIRRHKLAKYTLLRLDQEPDLLEDFFDNFPEKKWSQKYVWNYSVTLKALIQFFIDRNRIAGVVNPCKVLDIDYDFNSVSYVPTAADYDRVYMATYTTGLSDDIRNLLAVVYESGLRVNEVMPWQVEDLDLSLPRHDERGRLVAVPSFKAIISKQRKKMIVRRPMSRQLHDALVAQIGNRKAGPIWPWKNPPYSVIRWMQCTTCGQRHNRSKRARGKLDCACGGRLVMTGLYEEAGLKDMRPFHDYRYSRNFINRIEKGLDKDTAKSLQGHKTDAMHDLYLVREALDLAPAIMDSWSTKNGPTVDQK